MTRSGPSAEVAAGSVASAARRGARGDDAEAGASATRWITTSPTTTSGSVSAATSSRVSDAPSSRRRPGTAGFS